MASASEIHVDPISLHQDDGEARWVVGMLVIFKATSETTGGRVAVVDHLAPQGAGPPLHVHTREDEWFYIIDGAVRFWVGGQVIEAKAGSFVYGPRNVPHTFLVTSPLARFLVVAEPAGFEAFLRKISEPARALTVPPVEVVAPPPERMIAIAAEYGVEILGPPGIPEQA